MKRAAGWLALGALAGACVGAPGRAVGSGALLGFGVAAIVLHYAPAPAAPSKQLGEHEWSLKSGKVDTAVAQNSLAWALLVAKSALKRASLEARNQADKKFFEFRAGKAEAFYKGMYQQTPSIPAILAHARDVIGSKAPTARAWLVERAKRYAVAFESYQDAPAPAAAPVLDPAMSTTSAAAIPPGIADLGPPSASTGLAVLPSWALPVGIVGALVAGVALVRWGTQ